MKLKSFIKILQLSLVTLAFSGLFTLTLSGVVLAGEEDPSSVLIEDSACKAENPDDCIPDTTDPALTENCKDKDSDCNLVEKYVNPLINTLAAAAGIAVVIGIIIGGIQYSSSGGDPQKAAAGKKHIKMAVIALVGFLLLYAFLNFLVPGGLR